MPLSKRFQWWWCTVVSLWSRPCVYCTQAVYISGTDLAHTHSSFLSLHALKSKRVQNITKFSLVTRKPFSRRPAGRVSRPYPRWGGGIWSFLGVVLPGWSFLGGGSLYHDVLKLRGRGPIPSSNPLWKEWQDTNSKMFFISPIFPSNIKVCPKAQKPDIYWRM